MCNSYSFEFQKNSYFLRRFEVSRAGCPGKPVAARGLVNGRGPRRQAWEGWSEAEGLQDNPPANLKQHKERGRPLSHIDFLVILFFIQCIYSYELSIPVMLKTPFYGPVGTLIALLQESNSTNESKIDSYLCVVGPVR